MQKCITTISTSAKTDWRVSTYPTVNDVPESILRRLINKEDYFCHPEYLSIIESNQSGVLESLYVCAEREAVSHLLMHFQIVSFRGAQLNQYIPSSFPKLLRTVAEWFFNRLDTKVLVAGNIFMTGDNGIHRLEQMAEAEIGEVFTFAVNSVLLERKDVKGVLIADLYQPEGELSDALKKFGFSKIEIDDDMWMTLPDDWKSFEDYKATLSSKYRIRLKKVFEKTNHLNVNELNGQAISACEEKLYDLYRKVTDKVDFKLGDLQSGYFSQQKSCCSKHYFVKCYASGNQLLGYTTFFKNGKTLDVHYIGMDTETAKGIQLYERMLYDIIAYGIENRLTHLHFGRTAPEVKSTVGALPQGMYGYVYHRNCIINFFFSRLAGRMKAKPYILRHPFKNGLAKSL